MHLKISSTEKGSALVLVLFFLGLISGELALIYKRAKTQVLLYGLNSKRIEKQIEGEKHLLEGLRLYADKHELPEGLDKIVYSKRENPGSECITRELFSLRLKEPNFVRGLLVLEEQMATGTSQIRVIGRIYTAHKK